MSESSRITSGSANHICIFLASLAGGGAERVMVTLANGFAASGRRVTMVLGQCSGPFRDEVAPQVKLIDLNKKHISFALPMLVAVLREQRPDVLLSALHVTNLTALFAAQIARTRVPVVVSEHSSISHILASRSWLRRLILRNAIRTLYPFAARVVTVSQGTATGLRRAFARASNSIETIPNPIDIEKVRNSTENHALPPQEVPIVIAVGRLAVEKRFSDLIRAVALVRKSVHCRLEILGDGPELAALKSLRDQMGLADTVSFPGFQKNPFPAIQRASVLVVSSDREGFGNTLVEAMALGIPVVSTNCPYGPSEILEEGRWGHLVPVGDIGALASAIIATLEAPPVRPEDLMARSEAFAKDQAVDSYLGLLDEVASDARQSK